MQLSGNLIGYELAIDGLERVGVNSVGCVWKDRKGRSCPSTETASIRIS